MRDFLAQILPPVLAALGTALGAALGVRLLRLVDLLSQKTHIQVSAETKNAIAAATSRAVLAVEEMASKATMDALQKHAAASAKVSAEFPDLTKEEIDGHIHAALVREGLGKAVKDELVPVAPPMPPPHPRSEAGFFTLPVLWLLAALGLLGLCLALSGCAGCQTQVQDLPSKQQWAAAGIDTAMCVGTNLLSAAGDAMVEALTLVEKNLPQSPDTWKAEGLALAKKYGPQAALCAVGKIWNELGGLKILSLLGSASPQDPRLAKFAWLITHQSEWTGLPAPSPSPHR